MTPERVAIMPEDDWLDHDPWRVLETHPTGREYYQQLTEFIESRGIQSVVEIGVRTGYSMAAMLRGNPHLTYLGIDDDLGQSSGISGGISHANRLLTKYAKGQADIWTIDSHELTDLPQRFDLAYIDGDHSELGCRQDLELVRAWADLILVDDYQFLPTVRRAVEVFCASYRLPMEYLQSYRGWALIDTRLAGHAPEAPPSVRWRGSYIYPHAQATLHPILGLLQPGPVEVPEDLIAAAEACVAGGTLRHKGDADAT